MVVHEIPVHLHDDAAGRRQLGPVELNGAEPLGEAVRVLLRLDLDVAGQRVEQADRPQVAAVHALALLVALVAGAGVGALGPVGKGRGHPLGEARALPAQGAHSVRPRAADRHDHGAGFDGRGQDAARCRDVDRDLQDVLRVRSPSVSAPDQGARPPSE